MFKKIYKKINDRIKRYLFAADGVKFSKRYDFLKGFLGWSSKIEWDSSLQVFLVSDSHFSLRVPRKSRLKYYQRGVENRLRKIINEYQILDIILSRDDIILDIGANIGEFSMALARDNDLRVIAVEPEEIEVCALRENLKGINSEIYVTPVWSEVGTRDFFPCNDSGDSSLICQDTAIQPISVDVTTVDEVLRVSQLINPIESIKLVKLEAEGAEPEVLLGMETTLSRVEFIAVDVGAERGLSKENTLIDVLDILMPRGFRPIKFGLPRAVLLLRNTQMD